MAFVGEGEADGINVITVGVFGKGEADHDEFKQEFSAVFTCGNVALIDNERAVFQVSRFRCGLPAGITRFNALVRNVQDIKNAEDPLSYRILPTYSL
jgi:hypothetical protein